MIRLSASALLYIVLGLSGDSVSGRLNNDKEGVVCQVLCPPGWVNFEKRCFQYIRQEKTWVDAELDCISKGGNLASVHSEEEHQFLKQQISSKEIPMWLGGTDCYKEGTWFWSDGAQWNWVKWNTGEPNNAGIENCIHLNYDQEGWNDISCNNQYPYICARTP
uniref:C-type lectin domain-containing protein n=2 Tax=Lepisosteus oculatus TaxID=7918 RepID=W5MQN5_LEPOC